MEPSEHAKLSPSAAHRWMSCPGSIRESEGWPDSESAAAAEGTFAHGIAARCLSTGHAACTMVGESDGVHTVDDEMAAHLQVYLDVVGCYDGPLLVEKKVGLYNLRDDITGTADAIVFGGSVLHVFDLKYGAGIYVEVDDNPQLKIYGLAALLTYPEIAHAVETVHIHIVQPRHHQGPAHRSVEIPAARLWAWGLATLRNAAEATEEPDAPLVPGGHCQFCPAKAGCPTLKEHALAHAQDVFRKGTMTPKKALPPVKALTPEEMRAALDAFDAIELWIKAVREHAYEQANKGTEIPGYKLVDKSSRRKWRNEREAAMVLEAYAKDASKLLTDPKLVSPAQAEKLIPKDLRAIIDTLAVAPKAGTVLVPESDPRDPHNGAGAFDVVPEV